MIVAWRVTLYKIFCIMNYYGNEKAYSFEEISSFN